MKIEIIGGTKEWRTALRKKLAKDLDPKGVLEKPKRKRKPKKQ
tara:strand:+ start:1083 stop:1211 length:129 start_codon:yes stop_codon:yes gene_type:complete